MTIKPFNWGNLTTRPHCIGNARPFASCQTFIAACSSFSLNAACLNNIGKVEVLFWANEWDCVKCYSQCVVHNIIISVALGLPVFINPWQRSNSTRWIYHLCSLTNSKYYLYTALFQIMHIHSILCTSHTLTAIHVTHCQWLVYIRVYSWYTFHCLARICIHSHTSLGEVNTNMLRQRFWKLCPYFPLRGLNPLQNT